MFHDFRYPAILAASNRAAWQIDDVIPTGAELDFSRPFMPESLARIAAHDELNDSEKLTLNHIRGHEYLCLFGVVEEFILPFLMDHIRPTLPDEDDVRVRAVLQFAAEEAKHIQLFKRFRQAFARGQHRCAAAQHLGSGFADLDQAGALLEVIHTQRRRETRGARGGQHVVGAGAVVAQALAGVGTQEDGAGVLEQRLPLGRRVAAGFKVRGRKSNTTPS